MSSRLLLTVLKVSIAATLVAPVTIAVAQGRAGEIDVLPARPSVAGAQQCCTVVANPAMRGRLGRVAVKYPVEVAARMDVFRAGDTRSIASGYGDLAFDLLPGTYDVEISGKLVGGVIVQSGHDTQIKVGVLRVSAADATRIDLVDPAKPADAAKLTGGYGSQLFGLPIGEVGVQIDRQTEPVTITDGQVVDF